MSLIFSIFSFADDGLSLKVFLNEEIERLRDVVSGSLKLQEIKKIVNCVNSI